ncbi:MAG TPA: ATP-binding protein, partial [Chthoniobacteraceae bacterium]|nr:ATP-binding protein [Chthoniobacteraceae bacterium]
ITFSFWKPLLHMMPFTVYFAATAIIAARSGAWFGLGSALGAVAAVAAWSDNPPEVMLLRSITMLMTSALIIWLGAMLRRGASESSAFRQSIDEAVADFVWSADPGGKPISINARALAYFGKTREELSREGGWDFIHAGDQPMVAQMFRDAASSGEPCRFEARLRRHDGTFHWFAFRAVPIKNRDGQIVKWIGTSTDIDDRKRIELEREQLLAGERRARSEAEHTSRMKDEFLATLSHELRTPLHAITGWLHLLGGGGVEQEELREGLEVIARNTRLQTQLIEDLLDMNRIITGKLRLDVQSVKLPQVIDAALASIRPSAEAKGIRLNSMLDPRTAAVRGDPARLQQIIWNLLSNAVKFTPKGGRVDVLLERIESHVEITVSDSGAGIAPDFLPHIFERFRQADATTTRRHGGLGLGLAIARQLAELHGGTIVAASSGEGRGATFRVVLPLPAAQQQEGHERIHPAAGGEGEAGMAAQLDGVKVLVVDDEIDSREIVCRILKNCGAEVVTVASAGEALDALRTSDGFAVLVSDIGMPEMDGFEFLRQLRSSDVPAARTIPAIALTAFARSEDRRRAMQCGFDMFVSKPVDAPELAAVVERCAARTERDG